MPLPRRCRQCNERGFTLIEMMMALLVLGITMIPLSEVFIQGTKLDATTGQRTSAEQIATRAMEAIRAVPYNAAVAPNSYDMVGFYGDETFPSGYDSWYSSPTWANTGAGANPAGPLTKIVLGSCSTTCAVPFTPPIQPQSLCPAPNGQAASDCPAGVSYAGTTFTITRYIYWESSSGYSYSSSTSVAQTFTQAYKGITVIVSWSDASGTHSEQQDSVLYPGGQGVCATPSNCNATTTTTSTTTAVAPSQPTLTVSSTGQSSVTLGWTTPSGSPTGYVLQYSTSSAMTSPQIATPAPGASTTSYTVSGLSPVTYWFTLTATNAAGSSPASAAVSATPTGSGSTTDCQISGITVSPAKIYETHATGSNSTTTLSGAFTVTANVSTACGQTLQVSSAGHTTPTVSDPGSPYLLASPGG
ncbi:MAG TPA: fibronectin type III domain-containing protein, partial [Acidimicrobiales bacterium]|nr:fibronectin type III domain-containing protein [Acidimicrobiales bacterium]